MKITWHMPVLRRDTCGLSIRAVRLAEGLVAAGHAVEFVVEADRTDVAADSIAGIPVRRIEVAGVEPWHWSLQASARRRGAGRIVEAIGSDHGLFISCRPDVVSARVEIGDGAPAVFVCGGTTLLHDESDRLRNAPYRGVHRLAFGLDRYLKHCNEANAFRAADAVVFDSDMTRRLAIESYGLDAARCRTIHGGVDPAHFRPPTKTQRGEARAECGCSNDETLVVFTGRLSPEKNVELLIESLGHLRRDDIRAVLLGDGPEQSALELLARERDVDARVRFAGRCADVRPYLHAADIYAFPSRCESFGGALVEAMACGLACIAVRPDGETIRNASPEIIEDGDSGLLAEGTAPGYAAALARLADDGALRVRLGTAARRRATTQFTWDSARQSLCELVAAIGGRGNPMLVSASEGREQAVPGGDPRTRLAGD